MHHHILEVFGGDKNQYILFRILNPAQHSKEKDHHRLSVPSRDLSQMTSPCDCAISLGEKHCLDDQKLPFIEVELSVTKALSWLRVKVINEEEKSWHCYRYLNVSIVIL